MDVELVALDSCRGPGTPGWDRPGKMIVKSLLCGEFENSLLKRPAVCQSGQPHRAAGQPEQLSSMAESEGFRIILPRTRRLHSS